MRLSVQIKTWYLWGEDEPLPEKGTPSYTWLQLLLENFADELDEGINRDPKERDPEDRAQTIAALRTLLVSREIMLVEYFDGEWALRLTKKGMHNYKSFHLSEVKN